MLCWKRQWETRGISKIYSDGNLIGGIIVGADHTIGLAHPQTFSIRVTNNNTLGLIGELMLLTRLGQVDQSIKWLVRVCILLLV